MSRVFKPRFFKVEAGANDVKLYRDGGADLVGNYSVNGKIWHSLGQLKCHYLNCFRNTCHMLRLNYNEAKISGKLLELMPNNIVIEYKLVEVCRFPASDLFKKK